MSDWGIQRFLGLGSSLGRVAPGMLADLVLLDADPLADISNVAKVRLVILGGRVLDEAELGSYRKAGA